ncbi:NAD-dependent epimerase/dehydratase family protein [Novosphingobium lentum]|uniref:NAD-dependent epimerase/dehydratase family protein n=1 Tax=Novosphingobium lentum TaxID=145287 RepID=UPI000829DB1A|nr:NAD(P)-dependent oxidoreductase [Novosphingobium lentum]
MKPRTIAITGASGAIGSKLVKAARNGGRTVIALSRRRPADLPGDVVWRALDLSDPGPIHDVLEGADTVIHLATVICGESPDDTTAQDLWRVNVLGTRALVAGMAAVGMRHLVLASTANFYSTDVAVATEDTPIRPTSRTLYLGSKVAQEWVAASRCEQLGLSFGSLRIASVVGTGRSVIDLFALRLQRGQPVTISSNGTFGADFVDVDDVVSGLLLASDHSLQGSWNLSSGRRRLLIDVANDLAKLAGCSDKSIEVTEAGLPDHGFPAINCDKLRAEGYQPTAYADTLEKLNGKATAASATITYRLARS